MKLGIFGAFMVSCLSAANAGDFTGMQLRELCTAGSDAPEQNICRTWISGYQAGLFAAQTIAKAHRVTCLPRGFTGDQAWLIVEKFMKDHPNILHGRADVIAFVALSEAFPCGSPKNSN